MTELEINNMYQVFLRIDYGYGDYSDRPCEGEVFKTEYEADRRADELDGKSSFLSAYYFSKFIEE